MKYWITLILLPFIVFSSLLGVLMGRDLQGCPPMYYSSDTLLYLGMIRQSSLHHGKGDPFLYEHRQSPAISELNSDWVVVLGKIYSRLGFRGVLALILPFYVLWVGSLWGIYRYFGVPRGPSLCLSVLIVNVVFGIAGGFQGMHRLNWIFYAPWQDYWRLYPTAISMGVYAYCMLCILRLWRKEKLSYGVAIFTGGTFGLVIYGRPFDWTVALTFQALLFAIAFVRRDPVRPRHLMASVVTGMLVASPYIARYLTLSSVQHDLFEEILGRGNLQMKALSHYVKYALFMFATIGIIFGVRRFAESGSKQAQERPNGTLLVALALSAFLPHFATFPSGKTIVGVGYYFHASIVPWSFVACSTLLLWRWRHQKIMQSGGIWIFLALLIAVLDAWSMSSQSGRLLEKDQGLRDRQSCYKAIGRDLAYDSNAVVLTLEYSNELKTNLECFTYLTSSLNQTYIVSGSTSELFERFLAASELVRGHCGMIPEIIHSQGMVLSKWEAKMDDEERYWFELLRACIGSNSFIFHPERNRLDLRQKGIRLPEALSEVHEPVVYFRPELQATFLKFQRRLQSSLKPVGPDAFPFRLDYAILPKTRLRADFSRCRPQVVYESKLYKVLRFRSLQNSG